MTTSVLRTADAWWVQTATGAARVATSADSTRELLADRESIEQAAHSTDTVPVEYSRTPLARHQHRAAWSLR